jgi:hypothetical protein
MKWRRNMGHVTSLSFAEGGISLGQLSALTAHLTSNHYPPLPIELLGVCHEAINRANEGEWDVSLKLPEIVRYRGRDTMTVEEIVSSCHLDAWISEEV